MKVITPAYGADVKDQIDLKIHCPVSLYVKAINRLNIGQHFYLNKWIIVNICKFDTKTNLINTEHVDSSGMKLVQDWVKTPDFTMNLTFVIGQHK